MESDLVEAMRLAALKELSLSPSQIGGSDMSDTEAYEFQPAKPWLPRARRICKKALREFPKGFRQRRPGEVMVVDNWFRMEGKIPAYWEDKRRFEETAEARLDNPLSALPETTDIFERVLRKTESGKPGIHCIYFGKHYALRAADDEKICVYVRIAVPKESANEK